MAGLQSLPRVTDWSQSDPTAWRPFDYLKWPTLTSSTNQNFKLWLGSPNPGTDFGANFADEVGNLLRWGTTAYSRDTNTTFKASEFYFSLVCSQPKIIPPISGSLVNLGTADEIHFFADSMVGKDFNAQGNPIVYANGESPSGPSIKNFFYNGPRTEFNVGSYDELIKVRTATTQPGFSITYTVWHSPDGGATRDTIKSLTLFTGFKFTEPLKVPGTPFMLLGQPNFLYQVQHSSTLLPGSWTVFQDNVREGTWFTNQGLPKDFFRALLH